MPLYTVGRTAFTVSTSAESLIIQSSAKPLRLLIVDFKGLATSSSANEIIMFRGTTVGTSGAAGAITPSKVNTGSAAAAFTVFTSISSTTSSTAGDVMWRFGVNGNGGQDKFTSLPGAEISMPSSGWMFFRAATGGGSITGNLQIEEVDG